MSFLVIFAASAVAVSLLVALAAWARIHRPYPQFTEAEARALYDIEFPGRPIIGLYLAQDGAVARSGDQALVLFRVGDSYAARALPWAKAQAAPLTDGRLVLPVDDFAAPRARLTMPAWPPAPIATREAA